MTLSVSIRTFGCRLNQAEGASLAARFAAAGFTIREAGDPDCMVCLVHGCMVTRTAEKECLRWTRRLDRRRPRPLIVLSGCPAQTGDAAAGLMGSVDILAGRDEKWQLPQILRRHFGLPPVAGTVGELPSFRGVRAWLRIQDGCDFSCSYCIVPRARGAPRSRPLDEVLAEARRLIAAGHAELVVTGANIAAYRDAGGSGLVELAAMLARLPGLGRLRLGSIEPGTVELSIISLMREEPVICRYLHLPLQSGDGGILKAMRRRYTPQQFLDVAGRALAVMSDVGLGTDVITGFPGEDDAAFAGTRRLLESLPLVNLHVFPYSERPGTPAATMENQVPPALRRARAAELIELGHGRRRDFAAGRKGKIVHVLVEQVDGKGRALGYSGEYLPTTVTGETAARTGDFVVAVAGGVEGGRLLADGRGCLGPASSGPAEEAGRVGAGDVGQAFAANRTEFGQEPADKRQE